MKFKTLGKSRCFAFICWFNGRERQSHSHKHLAWNVFTDAVIELINLEKEHVVFMLWGNFAQKKEAIINSEKHLVLKSGHPSPLSANQGKWFGNKHFSLANKYLRKHNMKVVKWL